MKISSVTSLFFILSCCGLADGFSIQETTKARRKLSSSPLFSSSIADNNVDISTLPLPPNQGMNLYRNIRDSFSYLINPDRFIANRSAKLGPLFLTYQFFKPCVICGGQKNVQEFISGTEIKAKVTNPSLPDIFIELHTKWGSLNMDISEPMFKEARTLFGDVLSSRNALEQYSKACDEEIENYVNDLVKRVKENPDQAIYLAPELKGLCLDIFSEIFSGKGLTPDQKQQFQDYNSALLALSRSSEGYKKGRKALDDLRVEMLARFRALDGEDIPADTPGKWYHDQIYGRFDNEERISTGMILFIWGAYVECASLMVDSLALSYKYGLEDKLEGIREEFAKRAKTGMSSSDPKFWNDMPYTTGICRESLRLAPPGAGVPRFSNEDFKLAGYRIPAGTPVMLEPRIGNLDPNLHKDPQEFQPIRWVPPANDAAEGQSSCPFRGTSLKLGLGSWFPGGFGAHQCPGVPLAEMVGRIFLAKMSEKFDSWEFSGEGLTKEGEIDYIQIPVRIPKDNFGMKFKLKKE